MTWEELKESLLKKKGWTSGVVVNNFKEEKVIAETCQYKFGRIELDSRGNAIIQMSDLYPEDMVALIKIVEKFDKEMR